MTDAYGAVTSKKKKLLMDFDENLCADRYYTEKKSDLIFVKIHVLMEVCALDISKPYEWILNKFCVMKKKLCCRSDSIFCEEPCAGTCEI